LWLRRTDATTGTAGSALGRERQPVPEDERWLLLLGAIFVWRVGAEDELMAQQFPNEYPDYKKRTKALIPFVW
jgi:hypothetical protein